MEKPDVRIFSTAPEMSAAAAEAFAAAVSSSVRTQGRCTVALSGGETPRGLFTLLATTFREQVPWNDVHVFWVDERLVPPTDPRRNDQMAREMLLSKVACPEANIHPMATRQAPPDELARDYEETMKQHFSTGKPRFDLVILGLGAEGHTASLFPASPALNEEQRWVCPVKVPADPRSRLTLTLPVLNQASRAYFLVSGAGKARALRAVFDERTDPKSCPGAAVQLSNGTTTWWVDRLAAGKGGDQDMQKGAVEETDHDPIVPIEPLGANFEDSEVSQSSETGKTSDVPRDEQQFDDPRDRRPS